MVEEAETDRLAPEETFELLGNPARLRILRALWDAEEPVAFSALRRAAAVDDSGQFNYHLNRLVDRYVAATDDGYRLSTAGEYLVGAILADAIDQRPQFGSFPVEGTCRTCDGDLEAEFSDLGVIRCAECETVVMADAFPPAGAVDRSPEEIARAFDRWIHHRAVLAWAGVCPRCAAELDGEYFVGDDGRVRYEFTCPRCKHEGHGPLIAQLTGHPAVVSAYYARGVDLSAEPYWALRHRLDDWEETVVDDDPLRVRVTVPLDDGSLELTIDEHGDVIEVVGG